MCENHREAAVCRLTVVTSESLAGINEVDDKPSKYLTGD